MRKYIPSTLAAALTLACGVANADFTGSVAFTTDYVFRGISQTDEEPAIQGALNYNHESGVYAGLWGSNVDFNDGDEAHVEMDAYFGYAGAMDALGYDVGAIYYAYPGADSDLDYDYWELKGLLSYSFDNAALTPKIIGSVFYSPEFFGDTGDAVYVNGALALTVAEGVTLNASVGWQSIDDTTPDSYVDWKLGAAAEYAGLLFDLSYTDTDSDGEDLAGDLAEGRAVFTVSKSF
jgi:uncharacterized protein (TIGR02001 family)